MLWGASIVLHLVAIGLILVISTGHAPKYNLDNEIIELVIFLLFYCTILSICLSIFYSVLYIKKSKKRSRLGVLIVKILVLLVYTGSLVMWNWLGNLASSSIAKETSYTSPSGQKDLIFIKYCYIHCLNEVYEKQGTVQRKAHIRNVRMISGDKITDRASFGGDDELRDRYLNSFHDPSNINIVWSKDEKIATWTVQVESRTIEGVVIFRDD
ncbi:hypothetical protein [Baaleninema simplex]|uniref:hypothetical protein n=1 Tax=Baaleninema simplex TaxID=2862350 RepID=UPI00130DCAD8|nr:hypothetical protein [Baaleninema simplex]